MRQFLAIIIILISANSYSQVGVSGGPTFLKGFGYTGIYKGLHLGVEVPRDDMVSFFGRIVVTLPYYTYDSLPAYAIDPATTSPSQLYADTRFGNSFLNLQAGTRYYLGNGYDYGISAYGGSIFELTTLGVSRKIMEDIDESKYQFVSTDNYAIDDKGRYLAFSLGLNAGVKYNFSFGLLYLDFTGSYVIFGLPSNVLARDYGTLSQLNFGMNLGFRKDIF